MGPRGASGAEGPPGTPGNNGQRGPKGDQGYRGLQVREVYEEQLLIWMCSNVSMDMLGGVFSCTVFPPVVLGSKGLDGEGRALRSVWTDGGYDVHRRRLKAYHCVILLQGVCLCFFFRVSQVILELLGLKEHRDRRYDLSYRNLTL